ncbi:MAG: hypothetical protein LUB83_01695 [Prevotellaceae bacterium]|nr:hypothetical protein [Prevotellaceae bacterium]
MNKKFLSAILFGAILVTAIGTFVSCKDYDDDISSLQSQIDNLSSSSSSQSASLSSLQSSLESDLATVKSSLESELTSAKSSLESEITTAKAELEVAMSSKADASEISALSDKIASLTTDCAAKEATLTSEINAVNSAITALQTSSSSADDALQAAIDALTTSTSNGDSALQAAIDALESSTNTSNAALQAALEALTTSTSNGDNALQAAIDALKASTDGSNATLQAAIDSLELKCNASCTALNEAIEKLSSSSTDADKLLQKAIDELTASSETSAANYADLKAAVELLASSTATSDEELQAAIDDLTKAADTSYQALLKEITDLQTSGSAAYTALVQQITDLSTSSDDADAELKKLIDVLTASTDASVADLQSADAELQAAIAQLTSSTTSSYEDLVKSIADLAASTSDTSSALQAAIDALSTSTSASIADTNASIAELTVIIADLADSSVSSATLSQVIEKLNIYIESVELNLTAQLTNLQSSFTSADATLNVLTAALSDETAARKDADATLAAADVNLQLQIDALVAFQEIVESADYQSQIDALKKSMSSDTAANYAELSDKIAAVQEALNEQLVTVQDAIAANAANIAANAGNIAANSADIATNTLDIADLKEQLQTLSDAISEINPNLDAITVLVKTGVTSVEIMLSYTADNAPSPDLTLYATTLQENVFGTDEKGNKFPTAITFTAGDLIATPAQFVMRVSPTNADLSAAEIHFVNSKGENLDDFVEVTAIDTYNELLTRSTSSTGLYQVSVQLKNQADRTKFNAATKVDPDDVNSKSILYAVQVNNTTDSSEDRYVTSTYDLTMTWEDYDAASELWYFVGDKNVANYVNRYSETNNASLPFSYDQITYVELGWTGAAAVKAITSGTDKNADKDSNDDRSDKELYLAEVGEPITITITESSSDDNVDKALLPDAIRAMYVTLDYEENAVESAPSEWNAWNSYTYEGLNTVVDNKNGGSTLSTQITVTSSAANGDIIGFRVFAVNYDGTLVDPDGKAFYVSLGDPSQSLGTVTTTITPTSESTDITSDKVAVSLTNPTRSSVTWTTDQIVSGNSDIIFNIYLLDKDGNELTHTVAGSLDDSTVDLSEVASIYSTVESCGYDWKDYVDNQAYNGTLTFTDANGRTVATLTVTMTKVLPVGMPYDLEVKTNQLIDNKYYYAFMIPDDWTNATTGEMGMSYVFNYDPDAVAEGIISNYVITFATSTNNYIDDVDVAGDGTLTVDASYVDNKTYHTTTVAYNYGNISSVAANNPYTQVGYTFQTMYVDLYYKSVYSWAWAEGTDTSLIYGTDGQTVSLDDILGTSVKDSDYNATANGGHNGSLTITEAHLTTIANSWEDEYFTVTVSNGTLTFEPVSYDTNVTGDVKSTLTLTGTDCYGQDVVIELPMTVTKR